jgi:hypothetical protein
MSDGSCRVFGLLSILRYQQNIRARSASAPTVQWPLALLIAFYRLLPGIYLNPTAPQKV